jgi:hypothetical protein
VVKKGLAFFQGPALFLKLHSAGTIFSFAFQLIFKTSTAV